MNQQLRVRFAPSPTGLMHLGNVRAALINALFARKNDGISILRIEDTDAQRTVDPAGKQITQDLAWLGLTFDEGPYYQSKRTHLYHEYLKKLIKTGRVYRAFETTEELEEMRQKQAEQGLPPRYDRRSLHLTSEEINNYLAQDKPYIWRFKLPDTSIVIHDIARGDISFDLSHFSDFPLTRQDGSFTFLFANFVDDAHMKITHIFRGEDHLSNTANQAALYQACELPLPTFYHQPLLCNKNGKKLSKRDFGFSLNDLRTQGYLPEAILNYLAILGGSFKQEIMHFDQLVKEITYDTSSPTGHIHFDLQKLQWINHKWIARLAPEEIATRCLPFLEKAYPQATTLSMVQLTNIIKPITSDLVTLSDIGESLKFYFEEPVILQTLLDTYHHQTYHVFFKDIVRFLEQAAVTPEDFFIHVKTTAKTHNYPLKEVFSLIRIALTGTAQGIGIKDLYSILGQDIVHRRLKRILV